MLLSGMDVGSTVSATEKALRVADIPRGVFRRWLREPDSSQPLVSGNAGILSEAFFPGAVRLPGSPVIQTIVV